MKTKIAHQYLTYLENGETEKVIALFSDNGIVHSPVYGTKNARDFYRTLAEDTTQSELTFNSLFENDSNAIALYFTYKWTLAHGKVVEFDVVDIITFDENHKITSLKIIYDTVVSRKLVEGLNN